MSRYEWALVAGVLLIYGHIVSVNVPAMPHWPLVVVYPAVFALFGLFLVGCRVSPFAHLRLYRSSYQKFFLVFSVAVVFIFLLGLANSNSFFSVGNELAFLLVFLFFLLIGGYERIWYLIDRPATIMVYLGLVFVVVFKDVVAVQGFGSVVEPNLRLTNTVSFGFRYLLMPAVFLFIWGIVNTRSKAWKILQIGTIFPYLIAEVGFFHFRSALVVALLTIILVLFVYPVLQGRRVRWGSYVLGAVLVTASLPFMMGSKHWSNFVSRVDQMAMAESSVFAGRNVELNVFLSQMGPELIWGRGLGGRFDASSVHRFELHAHRWSTLHYGVFSFVLRGGFLFLAIFLAFFLFAFSRRTWGSLDSPSRLASILAVPIILFLLVTVPFLFDLTYMPQYLWYALVLAMLGTKVFVRRAVRWPPAERGR